MTAGRKPRSYHDAMAHSPRLRHRLRIVAICICLGAVVNVIVAWACAWRLDPDQVSARPLHNADRDAEFSAAMLEPLRIIRDQHASDDEIVVCDEAMFGVVRRVAFVDPYWRATTAYAHEVGFHTSATPPLLVRVTAGWPWPALVGRQRLSGMSEDGQRYLYESRWMTGVLMSQEFERRVMPLMPVGIGFACNTIVVASAACLMLLMPGAIRRALRRRSGLCDRCAYPRGTSVVCTECGQPLRS